LKNLEVHKIHIQDRDKENLNMRVES